MLQIRSISTKCFKMLILLSYIQIVSGTCYTRLNSSQPHSVVHSETVQSQRGCEVLCTANSQCTAFAFSPHGLQSWCALLGNPSTNTCTEPKQIFLRKEKGCPARDNSTAEFGEDPCVDEIDAAAFRGSAPICKLDPAKRHIIRAIAEKGSRVTLDNETQHTDVRRWPLDRELLQPAVHLLTASGRARVRYCSSKCGCAPLPLLNVTGGVPARTDTVGPCIDATHTLYLTVFHCSGQACDLPAHAAPAYIGCARLKCLLDLPEQRSIQIYRSGVCPLEVDIWE